MRIANVSDRLTIVTAPGEGVDVATASGGALGPDVQSAYAHWDELVALAGSLPADVETVTFTEAQLGNPVPAPSQVFAIGLNYREHAAESKLGVPDEPPTFTKFPSCLTGPSGQIEIPAGEVMVDWEVELVVVIGTAARHVSRQDAWDHVAGLTVGQDISERVLQRVGPAPQFSLGKSYEGFGPLGPFVVTPDEVENRDDVELGCSVNGQEMQRGRTADLIFDVPELIARLSAVTTLRPGDIVFTGTPSGVGLGREPQVFLQPGDRLDTFATGIGEMSHTFVAAGA